MNIHVNWLAVKRPNATPLLEELGLQEIGASNDERAAPYAYTVTPEGWLLLLGKAMRLKLDKVAPSLSSRLGRVVAGEVSDIVMHSSLQAWDAGSRLWSVMHGPEEGVEALEISGSPPEELAEIEARLTASHVEDERVDYLFDAPLELGERICGYRPDQPLPGPWILLGPATARSGPRSSALPTAIRADLVPALADHGWKVEAIRLPASGRTYDASRVRNGRFEAVRFLWGDDRRNLQVIPSVALLEGERSDGAVLFSGNVYRDPPGLLQRLGSSLGLGRKAKTYEDKVREAVALARSQLGSLEELIPDPATLEAAD